MTTAIAIGSGTALKYIINGIHILCGLWIQVKLICHLYKLNVFIYSFCNIAAVRIFNRLSGERPVLSIVGRNIFRNAFIAFWLLKNIRMVIDSLLCIYGANLKKSDHFLSESRTIAITMPERRHLPSPNQELCAQWVRMDKRNGGFRSCCTRLRNCKPVRDLWLSLTITLCTSSIDKRCVCVVLVAVTGGLAVCLLKRPIASHCTGH